MGMSDKIEAFINELLKDDTDEWLELKRNELASIFGCVPSQINYVISTRFNPDHGYIVESRRGGGRCREWGSVLYCDEQGRRAGNEGKPGEPAADDGAPTTGRQRGGPDERGRGEEFDEKKKHPASLIRWAFVGTICMTAYSLKSALSNGFLLGSVFGLLECVVITPRYKKRKNIFSECCRQSRDPC